MVSVSCNGYLPFAIVISLAYTDWSLVSNTSFKTLLLTAGIKSTTDSNTGTTFSDKFFASTGAINKTNMLSEDLSGT